MTIELSGENGAMAFGFNEAMAHGFGETSSYSSPQEIPMQFWECAVDYEHLIRVSMTPGTGADFFSEVLNKFNLVEEQINKNEKSVQSVLWDQVISFLFENVHVQGTALCYLTIAIFAAAKKMSESDLGEHVMTTLIDHVKKMPHSLGDMRKEIVFSLIQKVSHLDPGELRRKLWLSLWSSELLSLEQLDLRCVLECMNGDFTGELWADFLGEFRRQCSEERGGLDVLRSVLNALIKAKKRGATLTDAQRAQIVEHIPEALKQNEDVSHLIEEFTSLPGERFPSGRREYFLNEQVLFGLGCLAFVVAFLWVLIKVDRWVVSPGLTNRDTPIVPHPPLEERFGSSLPSSEEWFSFF